MHRPFFQKLFTLFIAVSLILPNVILLWPHQAHAQFVPVNDAAAVGELGAIIGELGAIEGTLAGIATIEGEIALVETEETIWDIAIEFGNALAWQFAKDAIGQIADQIISWINSGFKDWDGNSSPFNMSNLEFYLGFVCNRALEEFTNQMAQSDLDPQIRRVTAGTLLQANPCDPRKKLTGRSISEAVFNSFMEDLSEQSGWRTYRRVMTNPRNTPFGQYMISSAALNRRLQEEKVVELEQLQWNKGFLSFRECREVELDNGTNTICENKTPGTLIEDRLATTLTSDIRQLELADEIDEIISALVAQLASQIFGGGGSLLDSGSGSSSWTPVSSPAAPTGAPTDSVPEDYSGSSSGSVNTSTNTFLIENQKGREESYASVKSDSLARLNTAAGELLRLDVNHVFLGEENAAYIAEQTARIDPAIATITANIDSTVPLIVELDQLLLEAEAATTQEERAAITNTLNDIQQRGHDGTDLTDARAEFRIIDEEVTVLEQTVEEKVQQQTSFDPRDFDFGGFF